MKTDNVTPTTEKVTSKAASLVETAADLADRAFEKAVDRADIKASTTTDKLLRGSRQTNRFAHEHSRQIGIIGMITSVVIVLGGLAWLFTGSRRSSAKQ